MSLSPTDQFVDDYDDALCSGCRGTGEGDHDGGRCYRCSGSGIAGSYEGPDPDEYYDRMRCEEGD